MTRKDLDVLTDDELARIFQHLPLIDDQGCRNAAIVSLMADCGLRPPAACENFP